MQAHQVMGDGAKTATTLNVSPPATGLSLAGERAHDTWTHAATSTTWRTVVCNIVMRGPVP